MDSKNILITLENCKEMFNVSQSRGCWKVEEMRDIGITYNNLCKIIHQLELKKSDDSEEEGVKKNDENSERI